MDTMANDGLAEVLYCMRLHVNSGRVLPKMCLAESPSRYTRDGLPLEEQREIVESFEENTIDHLEEQHGPFKCAKEVCGEKEVTLYKNHFMFLPSPVSALVLDVVPGVCGHGRCEVQASEFRKDQDDCS